ncbi:hypothetical protein NFJ02_21g45440 [Pycnococcus provasolii]
MLDELASEGKGSTSRDVERHCTSVLARFGNVRALEMRYGPAGTRVVASFDSLVDEETRDSIVAGSTVCLGGFYGDEQAEMRICSEDAPRMAPPPLVLSTNAPTNGGGRGTGGRGHGRGWSSGGRGRGAGRSSSSNGTSGGGSYGNSNGNGNKKTQVWRPCEK